MLARRGRPGAAERAIGERVHAPSRAALVRARARALVGPAEPLKRVGARLEIELMLQLELAFRRDVDDARSKRAAQPSGLAEPIEEGRAERPGKVVGSLGPVEALPREASARRS